jgi:hypothetical protein
LNSSVRDHFIIAFMPSHRYAGPAFGGAGAKVGCLLATDAPHPAAAPIRAAAADALCPAERPVPTMPTVPTMIGVVLDLLDDRCCRGYRAITGDGSGGSNAGAGEADTDRKQNREHNSTH